MPPAGLFLAAHEFAARNDLVINARYNFFDHSIGGQKRRQGGKTNQQEQGISFRIIIMEAVIALKASTNCNSAGCPGPPAIS